MIRPREKARPGRLKGEDLYNLRVACWLRDSEICTRCGIHTLFHAPEWWPNSYHMAHIKAKRMGGDSLDNVETLCGGCHRKYHNYGPSMEKPCPPKSRNP
jgi:5-methylcytosine-specific restriction endonuclease McrA